MKLYKKGGKVFIEHDGLFYVSEMDWDTLVDHQHLYQHLVKQLPGFQKTQSMDVEGDWDAPIGSQELWAAGVTYLRSKEAREKESAQSGGGSFYDKVYDAKRPELFFKSLSHRLAGNNSIVHIRRDSNWDVPEPELTLFVSSAGTIEGYTIGNDMSSRSIEGENPLYLAQAKVYDRCAALGPCLLVPENAIDIQSLIHLKIFRDNQLVFEGETSLSKMKRSLQELADFLFLETTFSKGVMLMTGTGIVPPDDFTLHVKDRIEISIDHIGTLINHVQKINR
ncbi:MAG: fumarylacetoacetate hydrolase family protein [Chitinophagaceae bacterium]|jgi:2-dehydro-3-deoxy-D-arabinonate dehydratase